MDVIGTGSYSTVGTNQHVAHKRTATAHNASTNPFEDRPISPPPRSFLEEEEEEEEEELWPIFVCRAASISQLLNTANKDRPPPALFADAPADAPVDALANVSGVRRCMTMLKMRLAS